MTDYFAIGWGLFFLIAAVLFIFFPSLKINVLAFADKKSNRIYVGIFTILLGIVHIYFHNIWTPLLAGIISLFGWISLLKGILIISYPRILNWSKSLIESAYFMGYLIVILVAGIYLLGTGLHWL